MTLVADGADGEDDAIPAGMASNSNVNVINVVVLIFTTPDVVERVHLFDVIISFFSVGSRR